MDGSDSLKRLAEAIRRGLSSSPEKGVRPLLESLFGERFQKRHFEPSLIRDAYALGTGDDKEGVPFAGLIHPDNPPSGPYGGTSLVWFPTTEHGSLIGFGVGTRGLSPDEGILTKPGHRRRLVALRRYLKELGVEAWTKSDPSALNQSVPKSARDLFPGFERVFQRYGSEMYCNAKVPDDPGRARKVVQAFVDLYAHERGWQTLQAFKGESDALLGAIWDRTFETVDAAQVHEVLKARRFAILQGPPGTGKTRLAEQIRRDFFGGRGITVQFHPAVTYEDFMVGLSPDAQAGSLRFGVRPGWLIDAARLAKDGPALLIIDEINRADLAKVLGEAVFLLEPGEVGGASARSVHLAHAVDGTHDFSLPEGLYVLGTMNTADRSIAPIDIAIRRRFAFVTLLPQRSVVAAQNLPLAVKVFDDLAGVFVEHAPEDSLDLLPGHAYFLAPDEASLRRRFHYELVPLLDEYLRQGLVGPAASELQAVRDTISDLASV
jgi:5-methylcytosine-specific restriction protein B